MRGSTCPGNGELTKLGVTVAPSTVARRPYDLRHAAVSLWLNSGVPATEVARRAVMRPVPAQSRRHSA